MWFRTLIVTFFFSIDKIIYNFIPEVYDLLILISRTSILSQADINSFATRVYTLLGIFMLFKVSFSLIQYVVNPDDFSDKSKGFSKLIKNSIISLCILVLTPYIFSYAFQLQNIILEDNVLGQVIFGDELNKEENNYLNTAGDTMAYVTMSAFFRPNLALEELSGCATLLTENGDVNPNCFGIKKENGVYKKDDTIDYSLATLDSKGFNDTDLFNYAAGVENSNLALMFRLNIAKATYSSTLGGSTGEEVFIIDYQYIFSTVVGVVILLLLVTFLLDIALRSVKLAFLQIIAPIPVISYIDPKSGKDGLFSKWYKMCFSTYISLFIRLLAIYFAVYIISMLGDGMVDTTTGAYISHPLVKIIIIIGVLMFAKQLPKILENLGIKIDTEGFTLNPIKKMEKQMLGGKVVKSLPAAALAGGAAFGANALSGIQNFKNSKGFKEKFKAAGRGLGSVAAGTLSATSRGVKGAIKGEKFGKNFSDSYGGAMKAKQSRTDRISNDVGFAEMLGTKFIQNIGGHTKGEIVKQAEETSKKIQSVYESMMNAAIGNDKETFTAIINGVNRTFDGIKGLKEFTEEVKKTTIDRNKYLDKNGNLEQEKYLNALQEQQNLISSLEDAQKDRLNDIAAGRATTQDPATTAAITEGYKQMKDLAKDLNKATQQVDTNINTITSGLDAKTINGMAKGISNQIIASTKASHEKTVDQYAAKKDQK